MAENKPGRGSDQFPLRLPDGMRDRLKQAADANGRSMNSEIIDRLAFSLENEPEKVRQLRYSVMQAQIETETVRDQLRDKTLELSEMMKAVSQLREIIDDENDKMRRLMFHVLNYLDEIPAELAIWAFNMSQILTRQEQRMPDDVARERIIEARERYNNEIMERLRLSARAERSEPKTE